MFGEVREGVSRVAVGSPFGCGLECGAAWVGGRSFGLLGLVRVADENGPGGGHAEGAGALEDYLQPALAGISVWRAFGDGCNAVEQVEVEPSAREQGSGKGDRVVGLLGGVEELVDQLGHVRMREGAAQGVEDGGVACERLKVSGRRAQRGGHGARRK